MMEQIDFRELTDQEVEQVAGGVNIDIGTQIGGQLTIIGMGVGLLAAGATAPFWFTGTMIVGSIALTTAHLTSGPSDGSSDS